MTPPSDLWCGVAPHLNEQSTISCGSETRAHFRAESTKPAGVPWWSHFHDWFCRNHPPTRAPQS